MESLRGNAVLAQSGGPTAVINASACGVIQEALRRPDAIVGLYGANNGILGIMHEDLFDLGAESPLRITVVRTAADELVMLLVAHHIAWDDGSWAVFFTDLTRAYIGETLTPAPRPSAAPSPSDEEDVAYWRSVMADPPEPLELRRARIHHRALRHDRHQAVHPQLGRLLHQPVEPLPLRHRRGQRHATGRHSIGQRLAQRREVDPVPPHLPHHRTRRKSLPVKHFNQGTGAEPADPAQMA